MSSETVAYKMVILVRQDLKLPKGKMAAQAAHAAVEASIRSPKEHLKAWHQQGQKKVVLKVVDQQNLFKYVQMAKENNLTTAVITDGGHTVVEPGTITCAAIGPDDEKVIDQITGTLQLM
ncbi:peptidyl-tRNA hydrolase [Candidatus Woesearchaeota archaeon]|nr:peptidyl-tRNA hydrolase [Candidatus Woesearchaeota archaeon]